MKKLAFVMFVLVFFACSDGLTVPNDQCKSSDVCVGMENGCKKMQEECGVGAICNKVSDECAKTVADCKTSIEPCSDSVVSCTSFGCQKPSFDYMDEKHISFNSRGQNLKGTIYLSNEDKNGPLPVIVIASGYTGVNAFYPRLFASVFVKRGYAVLGFDYEGYGQSAPPGSACLGDLGGPLATPVKIILEDQTQNIIDAIKYLKNKKNPETANINSANIGILGWGMAGGMVIDVGIKAPTSNHGVKAIAAINGFFDGRKFYKTVFDYDEFLQLENNINNVPSNVSWDPYVGIYPLDINTAKQMQCSLQSCACSVKRVQFGLAESIMNFNTMDRVQEMTLPLFVSHSEKNMIHPIAQSREIFMRANEPKQWHLISDSTHNNFMCPADEHFKSLTNDLAKFYNMHLKTPKGKSN